MDKNLVIAYQVLKEVQEGTGTMDAQTATHILNMLSNLKDTIHRRNQTIDNLRREIEELKECWKRAVKEIEIRDSIINDMKKALPEYNR